VRRRLLVLTGAGCSTESNLPDYRSPSGAYSRGFKPMTHQLFMSGPAQQSRYWRAPRAGPMADGVQALLHSKPSEPFCMCYCVQQSPRICGVKRGR